MDKAQQQLVMQSFYDRIFQMVTAAPSGNQAPLNPDNTLVQLVRFKPVNLDSYKNMKAPSGAANDNLKASQAFYELTNQVGKLAATFVPAQEPLENTYANIVNSANTAIQPTPAQKKLYNEAYNYLNTKVSQTGYTGKKVTTISPSTIFATYKANQSAYEAAVSAYMLGFTKYDLNKISDQAKWLAESPILETAVSQAWSAWVAGGKQAVEQALDALASAKNNFVSSIIATAQSNLANSKLASFTQGAPDWYMTFAQPANWWDPTADNLWIDFTLNSNYLHTSKNSYYQKTAASAGSSFLGLVSWGGHGGSSTKEQSYSMQGNNLSISCKMMTVTIDRPWMSDILFKTGGWSLSGEGKGAVSDGTTNASNSSNLLPIIPTSFVLVKDVSITANWTSDDKEAITKNVSSGGGFSFGPFHAGGSGSSGSSHSSNTSSFVGGTLSFSGVQMVAMINAVTDFSPPLADNGRK